METQAAAAAPAARTSVLAALRLHLQPPAQQQQLAGVELSWRLACLAAVVPPAAAHVHRLLGPGATVEVEQGGAQVRGADHRLGGGSHGGGAAQIIVYELVRPNWSPTALFIIVGYGGALRCGVLCSPFISSHVPDTCHTHIPSTQAVVETLKLLLVGLSVAAAAGPQPHRALLDLMLPLLIEAAAPEGAPPTPALTDVALKLISHLAGGLAEGSAAGFRAAVGALQPAAKQRLQVRWVVGMEGSFARGVP